MKPEYVPPEKLKQFSRMLLEEFPEFVQDNEFDKSNWEYAYLLIGEFKRFMIKMFRFYVKDADNQKRDVYLETLRHITEFIERYVEDLDEDISTLIYVGFLETVANVVSEDEYDQLKLFFGDKTNKALEIIDGQDR